MELWQVVGVGHDDGGGGGVVGSADGVEVHVQQGRSGFDGLSFPDQRGEAAAPQGDGVQRHFSTVFGPSTPGALNLVSGQTHGVKEFTAAGQPVKPTASDYTVRVPDANGVGTMITV